MAIDADIRDHAYQFFIQEAPELLQLIESELLTVKSDRSISKVHNMMRAAHSLKGGAASVGLDTIKTLAHSLEDIFKALHHEELEIDDKVEGLLLQAYDCLRVPLIEQLETGYFDPEQAMTNAEPVFAQIEAQFGDFIGAEGELPSSIDLGVDIALSIFEVDVAQGLDRLAEVLANPQGEEVAGELRAQAEVFSGLAELLCMPGFGEIANAAIVALNAHPDLALKITQVAFTDFQAARTGVINGDRTRGGEASAQLRAWASGDIISTQPTKLQQSTTFQEFSPIDLFSESAASADTHFFVDAEDNSMMLDDMFGDLSTMAEVAPIDNIEVSTPPLTFAEDNSMILDDMFGDLSTMAEVTPTVNIEVTTPPLIAPDLVAPLDYADADPGVMSIDDMFGGWSGLDITENAIATDLPLEIEAELPATFAVDENAASVDDIFGDLSTSLFTPPPTVEVKAQIAPALDSQQFVASIGQVFGNLPLMAEGDLPKQEQPAAIVPAKVSFPATKPAEPINQAKSGSPQKIEPKAIPTAKAPQQQLSVRVDLERLERMNNTVGELAISRNSLSLQNEQLQATVQELLRRFSQFQSMGNQLRNLSDRMLVSPERHSSNTPKANNDPTISSISGASFRPVDFDSLEMDSYGELHSLLQKTFEETVQLEETVGDVVLLAGQSSQSVDKQRQMLSHLRDDLMWARMLPIGEVLNRFPRMLRDLSTSYDKPAELKINGAGVLVDKAALEKLYDPLLHLIRNSFDHGIERPEVRREQGKLERGQIEIKAYHQGSQTIVEVRDDGRGINLERIRSRAVEMGLLAEEKADTASTSALLELMFEPGFSTASQVSELSGRGVGLDVVRSQLRSLKGSVSVISESGEGTCFTLRIPLTLTLAKLLVCFVGNSAFALPSDSIKEILIPQPEQVKFSGGKRFLHWQGHIAPAYHLSDLLNYACPISDSLPSQALVAVPSPDDWAAPMLLLEQDGQILALEIDRLVTEQELVIKPMGEAIASPSYIYGCTIVGDGSLIPVIDGAALLESFVGNGKHKSITISNALLPMANGDGVVSTPALPPQRIMAETVLVVDDSITLRQTLALTFEKAGYRVLQARDGREAIEQLQKNSATINLVVCDVEMPNMNGFEFLSQRRQDPVLSKPPVVMLTSRSSDKHRMLAKQLGAKEYFTKPYIEQEFLTAISNIIKQSVPLGVPALSGR
ncbi:hybrid sensor histidine kinase/response regulator [Chlorogloea sp. CCALA 695]|uniref:hybrid sensor histidine kinase/response regulator n=1 Tax=Chlorogloea sp. CCALA 695 TaxID=2107693 RepID=UPI000D054475|nr:hybrid sensor histidine kinase/response regulator [Chlorogloea sp. CCALA 695]PSB29361.1 hybrid sensor histidine kinase/response regulator [Chlorogloea sp. CCALA 695]